MPICVYANTYHIHDFSRNKNKKQESKQLQNSTFKSYKNSGILFLFRSDQPVILFFRLYRSFSTILVFYWSVEPVTGVCSGCVLIEQYIYFFLFFLCVCVSRHKVCICEPSLVKICTDSASTDVNLNEYARAHRRTPNKESNFSQLWRQPAAGQTPYRSFVRYENGA